MTLINNGCPLDIQNGKMKTIINEDDEIYLCHRTEAGIIVPNQYMVVPKAHVLTEPSWFSAKADAIVEKNGIDPDYSYVNFKKPFRTLPHFHKHYGIRTDDIPIGFNGLVDQLIKERREIARLESQLRARRPGNW